MQNVIITGFAVHARYLTRLLNSHTSDIRARFYSTSAISRLMAIAHSAIADASITYGGPGPKALVRHGCAVRGRPAVVIWAGSDVAAVAESPHELEVLRLQDLVHWASGPNLVAELGEIGIEARYVPTASAIVPSNVAPIPRTFTVLSYLPEPRRHFYGQPLVWAAARALPDARFLIIGRGTGERNAPPNVQYLGHVAEINSYLDESTILLRVPEHDNSVCQGIVEALARGRHAIWTHPFPGVATVHNRSDSIDVLRAFYDAHRTGVLTLNELGMEHIRCNYAPKSIASGIRHALNDAQAQACLMARDARRRRRIVISGIDILPARVAANCKRYSREIAPTVLSTQTWGETAAAVLNLLRSKLWYTAGYTPSPRALEIAAFLSRKPRVVHWIGDDVQSVELRRIAREDFLHLAHDDTVARRLAALGISSEVLPLPIVAAPPPSPSKLPERLTLLLYLPLTRSESFGRFQYERLMDELRDEPIQYIIVGGGHITVPLGISAEKLGWCNDLDPIYDRSTALLHFGQFKSRVPCSMIIEALLHGRYVLCAATVPLTIRIFDYYSLECAVRQLLRDHRDGTLFARSALPANMAQSYAPDETFRKLLYACERKNATNKSALSYSCAADASDHSICRAPHEDEIFRLRH